jgi:spore coat protein SA
MKIAIINQPCDAMLPPYENSIAIWTNRVLPYLREKHDVVVYARYMRKQEQPPADAPYIFIHSLHHRLMTEAAKLLPSFGNGHMPAYASTVCSLDYSVPVAVSLRRREVDIVHIHNYSQFVPVIRGLNPRVKIILHMNGEWLTQLPYAETARRVQMSDLVLGSSNYITQKIRDRFPQYAGRCHTVYNGVDVDVFQQASATGNGALRNDTRTLLFVGRVSPEKGVHVLLEAFAIAAAQDPRLELNIVGYIHALPIEFIVKASDEPDVAALVEYYENDYGATLKKLVPEHLGGRVHFLGPVPHADLPKYYRYADVLINPSFSESFGMSLVEAMASGKPVVATRVGGMTEIVGDGRCGVLVPRGDPHALADAILRVVGSDETRRQMGRSGRARAVSLYSWSQIAARILTLYEAV